MQHMVRTRTQNAKQEELSIKAPFVLSTRFWRSRSPTLTQNKRVLRILPLLMFAHRRVSTSSFREITSRSQLLALPRRLSTCQLPIKITAHATNTTNSITPPFPRRHRFCSRQHPVITCACMRPYPPNACTCAGMCSSKSNADWSSCSLTASTESGGAVLETRRMHVVCMYVLHDDDDFSH